MVTDNSDPFVIARQYANVYGGIASSFSTLIRRLCTDNQRDPNQLSSSSKWSLSRLLKADSMRSPYFYAARLFYPSKLPDEANLTDSELTSLLSPDELPAFLTVLYLYRRARRIVTDEKEWEYLNEGYHLRVALCTAVGRSMKNIGPGLGMLAGAMHFFGFVAFLVHDKPGYIEYRRQLKIKKARFDLDYELKRWGCTHIQVASNLLLLLGFPADTAQALRYGYEIEDISVEGPNRKAFAVRISEIWADSLADKGKAPEIVHSGNFYPVKEDLANLNSFVSQLGVGELDANWLDKGKADISSEAKAAGGSPKETEQSAEMNKEADEIISEISE